MSCLIVFQKSIPLKFIPTKLFYMLQEPVEFYQQNELSDSFPEVNTTLVHPYKTILYVAGTCGILSTE